MDDATVTQPPTCGKTLELLTPVGHVRPLVQIEEETIRFAIAHYDGQMSEVARRLGIGRSTLYRKVKQYGISLAGAVDAIVPADAV